MEELKMKKIAGFVASLLVMGSFSTTAFAAEADTQVMQTTQTVQVIQTEESAVSYKEAAGITPDNLLYIIDKAVDELRVILADTSEEKAAVNAEIAQERLGESEVMAEKGKVELALKALEEYNKKIIEAAVKLQEVAANLEAIVEESPQEVAEENSAEAVEEGTGEAIEENTQEAVEENEDDKKLEQSIAELEKVILEIQEQSLVVLDSLKGVVGEESVEDVEEVIEEQKTHKEVVANFVKERHEFNAAKKTLNMARVALKKVEKHGSPEDVKDAQEKLSQAQKEYMIAQAELHGAFQAKKAADLGIEQGEEAADVEEADNKEVVQAPVEEDDEADNNEVAYEDKDEDEVKIPEYTKTNNGNGNGNGNKQSKIEKEKKDKANSAPGKSGQAPGKSGQAKGKNK